VNSSNQGFTAHVNPTIEVNFKAGTSNAFSFWCKSPETDLEAELRCLLGHRDFALHRPRSVQVNSLIPRIARGQTLSTRTASQLPHLRPASDRRTKKKSALNWPHKSVPASVLAGHTIPRYRKPPFQLL